MVHSMTGFAAQTRELGPISLHLEIRSVNSRFLDLTFRVGEELRQAEPALRELITARLARGKVECRCGVQRRDNATRDFTLNGGLLGQLEQAQSALLTRFPAAQPLSVAELLHWPGMLADDGVGFDEMRPILLEMTKAALEDLLASRRREGEKLAAMIRERLVRVRELVAQVQPRMPELVAEHREKLATRLREAVATLDEDRIRQEVSLFAQRIDVAEELSRLIAHVDESERILSAGGASGKRLDFLMQEFNREANTLASKASAADVTSAAMELKVLIEQMREQVQNLE